MKQVIAHDEKPYLSLHRVLPIIIILEGFVSISAEILTIRQLLPVAGGNVIVTSLIIGIFLLFLALGYQYGGRRLKNPTKYLRSNFYVASFWLGVGLSYTFVYEFFTWTQKFTGPHIVYPLILYLLLIIAPLIFILGQTVPITMNLAKQDRLAGAIGGRNLSLSTIGSFLGAILTSLLLLHFFGVGWAIFANFAILISLALLLTESMHGVSWEVAIFGMLAVLVFFLNVQNEKLLFLQTNNYANYQILTANNADLKNDEKILVINNGLSSYTNATRKGFPYIELMKRLIFFDLKLHNRDVLVLGAGGFSLSAEYDFGNRFTYVDIDSTVQRVTANSFKQSANSRLIVDDARHYLQSTQKTFDVIVVDAYSDIKAIPAHLLTFEFMYALKKRLTVDGIALFNVIANPMLSDPYSKRVHNTIQAVFRTCMGMPITYSNHVTNIVYACHNDQSPDKTIYTDNLNRSTTDVFTW